MVKMLSFFKPFSIQFQIYRRCGKRQTSLHDNKKFSHVDRTHFIHCTALGYCHFFPPKRGTAVPAECDISFKAFFPCTARLCICCLS